MSESERWLEMLNEVCIKLCFNQSDVITWNIQWKIQWMNEWMSEWSEGKLKALN